MECTAFSWGPVAVAISNAIPARSYEGNVAGSDTQVATNHMHPVVQQPEPHVSLQSQVSLAGRPGGEVTAGSMPLNSVQLGMYSL